MEQEQVNFVAIVADLQRQLADRSLELAIANAKVETLKQKLSESSNGSKESNA